MRYAIVTYKDTDWIRGIAETLDEELNVHYIKGRNGDLTLLNREFESIQDQYESIIRFGGYGGYYPNAKFEYNHKNAIKLASDKLKARKTMIDDMIPCPKTYSRDEIVSMNWSRIDYPIIQRNIKHHGGRDVTVINSASELEESLYHSDYDIYFSEFYPKSKEFRVHVASGKAIIVAEKLVPEEMEDEVVWNLNDNGVCHDFNTYRWSEYRQIEEVITTASLAVRSLGLDYGAVDVVAYPKEREEYLPPCAVLEVNTAPRLEEYGISRYAQYFKWLFMHSHKRAEYTLPHELNRFSFTNDDFEQEYDRLENMEVSEDSENITDRLSIAVDDFADAFS